MNKEQIHTASVEKPLPGPTCSLQKAVWSNEHLMQIYAHWLRTGNCLLSPYPKTYEENMRWRLKMLRRAENDSTFRAKVKALFHQDILFAFNAFFYTLDPRRRPRHHRPFCTFPYQDLVLLAKVDHINRGQDLTEEKSRDMGASWTTIGVFVWLWLHPEGGYDFLLGSRIEDYVDKKGDPRTLFEKARYILRRLPWWLMPKGFSPKKHDNFMKLLNPETGSSMTGESNNANFATGGRYKAIFPDEFAKWKDTDQAAWTSMADATPCRMPASTPFGAFGQYFNVISDGKTKKLTMHWSLHPTKGEALYCPWPPADDLVQVIENARARGEAFEVGWFHWKGQKAWLRSPWYDAECARRDLKTIAQELDIDYIGSGTPVFTGIAASRMMELLRVTRKPKAVFTFDTEFNLVPADLENYEPEGALCIYEMPTSRSDEVVGVDVVEGKEHGDYAVIKGLNRNTKCCSFTYFSRIDEVGLARVLRSLNNWLCQIKADEGLWPWIGIETNGPGLATFDLCVEYGVMNLFLTPVIDHVKESIAYQKGWKTTTTTRKKLVGSVKEWLTVGSGWVDPRCTREMTSFVYKTAGRAEAAQGTNDDEVIAWGICLAIDEILPGGEYRVPKERREDGLDSDAFNLDAHRLPAPETIHELCLATISEKKGVNRYEERRL